MATSERDIPVRYKSPGGNLDFGFDWSDWLATGESVTSVTAEVSSGLTLGTTSFTTTTTSSFISGGAVGGTYNMTHTITTATRTDERSVTIKVINR